MSITEYHDNAIKATKLGNRTGFKFRASIAGVRFVYVESCALFMVIGVIMLGVSVMLHEIGHVVACVAQGFEVIDINFLMSYVICAASTQIDLVMGGGMGGLVMMLFLCVKQIRSCLPACLVFLAAMLTQFLNMILEGFFNPAYREFDLQDRVNVYKHISYTKCNMKSNNV